MTKIFEKIIGALIIVFALYIGYVDVLDHDWRYVTPTDKQVKYYSISEDKALKLYQLMKDTHDILVKHKIDYWIDNGTLLGAVRNKGIIPFDDDLDIGVLHQDEIRLQAIAEEVEKRGYSFSQKTIYAICTKVTKLLQEKTCLDIFIYHKKDNKFVFTNLLVRNTYPKAYFYDNEIFPLKKYQFGEVEVYGPDKAKGYLDRQYPEWDIYAIIQQPHKYHVWLSAIEKKTKFILTPALLKAAQPTGPLR